MIYKMYTNENAMKCAKTFFERQNFIQHLGLELLEAQEGMAKLSCTKQDFMTQQTGLWHGGVIAAIAEVACGIAASTVKPDDKEILGVEFKNNMLRPASGEQIIAIGKVLKNGRRLIITEAEIMDADSGKLLSKMITTIMVVEK